MQEHGTSSYKALKNAIRFEFLVIKIKFCIYRDFFKLRFFLIIEALKNKKAEIKRKLGNGRL